MNTQETTFHLIYKPTQKELYNSSSLKRMMDYVFYELIIPPDGWLIEERVNKQEVLSSASVSFLNKNFNQYSHNKISDIN